MEQPLKDLAAQRAQLRYDSLCSEAQEKLADAQQQLDDARKQLETGWAEYYDGLAQYKDGHASYIEAPASTGMGWQNTTVAGRL